MEMSRDDDDRRANDRMMMKHVEGVYGREIRYEKLVVFFFVDW